MWDGSTFPGLNEISGPERAIKNLLLRIYVFFMGNGNLMGYLPCSTTIVVSRLLFYFYQFVYSLSSRVSLRMSFFSAFYIGVWFFCWVWSVFIFCCKYSYCVFCVQYFLSFKVYYNISLLLVKLSNNYLVLGKIKI